jgi:hypothetical protein
MLQSLSLDAVRRGVRTSFPGNDLAQGSTRFGCLGGRGKAIAATPTSRRRDKQKAKASLGDRTAE